MARLARDLKSSFKDAIAYAKGDKTRAVETVFDVPDVDVKAVREKTGLTQDAFSHLFAIRIRTLQDWEQHRRRPTAMARVLLAIIDRNPKMVRNTLEHLKHNSH